MVQRFFPLRVASVRALTDDAIAATFDPHPAFRDFVPGQYSTLRTTIDGRDVRRCYSLCSAPGEPLRVGIKLLPGGVFSDWAATSLRPGVAIDVAPPEGRFGVAIDPAAAHVYAAFAAGSGITPVLSILKSVLAREPNSRCFLFFGNRATKSIMFRDELEDLKDRHMSRLSVFHVLSRETQELEILDGRLDAAKIPALTRLFPAPDRVFVCGPQAMIEGLEPALAAAGIPPDRIQVERFTPAADGATMRVVVPPDAPAAAIATLILDGARIDVKVATGETIVDAAVRAGLDPPFSCRAGMCCTCRARLIEGRATMLTNYSLEPWETEAGYILTCQARPDTARVTVDYDHV